MEHLLRAYFKKCNPSNSESRIDNLLSEGANAALQSHSVRLMLAYTLGVIDIGMFVALNRLRDIRNAFAHRTDNEPPMITYEIARELLNSLYSSQSPPRPHVSLAIPNPNPSQTHPMFSSRHFSGNRRAKGTHPRAEIGK
jgi:DNA-binding MltR family transcriptional regulator